MTKPRDHNEEWYRMERKRKAFEAAVVKAAMQLWNNDFRRWEYYTALGKSCARLSALKGRK